MVAGRTAPVLRNLGCAEDTQLGGHYVDLILADHAMEKFLEKFPKLSDAKNSMRAKRKLLAQAIKTKTTLSANKEAPFSIESMYEDTDFFTMVQRTKLEEMEKASKRNLVSISTVRKLQHWVQFSLERTTQPS